MALNVGRLSSLMELYAGQAGVVKDKLNPVLLREMINIKLVEFSSRTGVLSSKSTIYSIADQQEYELPIDAAHITKVNFDSYVAHKITFEQVDEIRGYES